MRSPAMVSMFRVPVSSFHLQITPTFCFVESIASVDLLLEFSFTLAEEMMQSNFVPRDWRPPWSRNYILILTDRGLAAVEAKMMR